MKITKVAQMAQPQPQQGQGGQSLQEALDPRMAQMIRQALVGTGLTKEKVLPFLEQLFTAMGDVQISKVKQVIEALQEEQPAQQAQQAQQVQQAPSAENLIVQPQQ